MAGLLGSGTGLPTGGAAPDADPVPTSAAIVAAVTAVAKIRDVLRRTYIVITIPRGHDTTLEG
jgi:hypothetical protein